MSVLPNGLRLIVQPEHVSHTVSVYGRVREETAMEEPPGKEGVGPLTRELFSYGTASATGSRSARRWTTSARRRRPGQASRSRC